MVDSYDQIRRIFEADMEKALLAKRRRRVRGLNKDNVGTGVVDDSKLHRVA